MARIKLADLPVDQTLDANALEHVRGGIIIINNMPTDQRIVKIDSMLWKYEGIKVQDANYIKIRGYDL